MKAGTEVLDAVLGVGLLAQEARGMRVSFVRNAIQIVVFGEVVRTVGIEHQARLQERPINPKSIK